MSIDGREATQDEKRDIIAAAKLAREAVVTKGGFSSSLYMTAMLYELANLIVFHGETDEQVDKLIDGLRYNITMIRGVEAEVREAMKKDG